jgi:hypothetical protein
VLAKGPVFGEALLVHDLDLPQAAGHKGSEHCVFY